MTDEHQLIKERERAHLAKQVIENPVWEEAWSHYQDTLRAHMENPEATDDTVLEARKGLIVLNRIRRRIEQAMTTGDMAAMQLETLNGKRTRTAAVN